MSPASGAIARTSGITPAPTAFRVIFYLANAAMLPLVGQKLTLQDKNQGTALMRCSRRLLTRPFGEK